jgi:hypothetical protein
LHLAAACFKAAGNLRCQVKQQPQRSDVQELLGHKDVKTMMLYTHVPISASGVYGVKPTACDAAKGAGSYTELYKTLREYDLEPNREEITWT